MRGGAIRCSAAFYGLCLPRGDSSSRDGSRRAYPPADDPASQSGPGKLRIGVLAAETDHAARRPTPDTDVGPRSRLCRLRLGNQRQYVPQRQSHSSGPMR